MLHLPPASSPRPTLGVSLGPLHGDSHPAHDLEVLAVIPKASARPRPAPADAAALASRDSVVRAQSPSPRSRHRQGCPHSLPSTLSLEAKEHFKPHFLPPARSLDYPPCLGSRPQGGQGRPLGPEALCPAKVLLPGWQGTTALRDLFPTAPPHQGRLFWSLCVVQVPSCCHRTPETGSPHTDRGCPDTPVQTPHSRGTHRPSS